MSPQAKTSSRLPQVHPRNCWYMLATSEEVGREPLGRRALDTGVVLFRTTDRAPVALEDRCAHRPYPLSLGRVDGDNIVSGYTGFVYDARGFCVHVPTQSEIPVGARVRAFPVHEDGVFVWAWLGEPSLAALRPPPATPWLNDPGWSTLGEVWETKADLLLLHENFADITHVAVVDPYIAPPVLRSSPPPLEVEVTETTVSFSRTYQPAPIPAWQAELLGLPAEAEHVQHEQGAFVTPGLWVDRWDVHEESEGNDTDDPHLPLHTRHNADLFRADSARVASKPELRSWRAGGKGAIADLHRLLPAGAADSRDDAGRPGCGRTSKGDQRQRRRRSAPGAQDHPQHGGG